MYYVGIAVELWCVGSHGKTKTKNKCESSPAAYHDKNNHSTENGRCILRL